MNNHRTWRSPQKQTQNNQYFDPFQTWRRNLHWSGSLSTTTRCKISFSRKHVPNNLTWRDALLLCIKLQFDYVSGKTNNRRFEPRRKNMLVRARTSTYRDGQSARARGIATRICQLCNRPNPSSTPRKATMGGSFKDSFVARRYGLGGNELQQYLQHAASLGFLLEIFWCWRWHLPEDVARVLRVSAIDIRTKVSRKGE